MPRLTAAPTTVAGRSSCPLAAAAPVRRRAAAPPPAAASRSNSGSISSVDVGAAPPAATPELAQKRADLKVLVYSSQPYTETYHVNPLREAGFTSLKGTEARLDEETARISRGYEAVCLFVNDTCNARVIDIFAERGIKFIAMRCAGYDRVDVAAANAAGIKIARVPTYSPTSVAEHAVALMFTIERHVAAAYARVQQGNYSLSGLVGRQMGGKTVGVFGTGAIGAEAARIFKGIGMKVLAYDVKPNPAVEKLGIPYLPWEDIIPRCDVVSLHMPLLPSTKYFIDARKIAMMKPGVTILNVSRGGLIETSALLQGVVSGHIGGVGLDVYEREAGLFFQDLTDLQPRDRMQFWDNKFSELVALPQVLVTPHTAFLTAEALTNITSTTAENFDQYLLGAPLTNEVLPPPPAPAASR